MSKNNLECEMCGHEYIDPTLSKEEIQDHEDSIREHGRCCDCYEEWGDNWADTGTFADHLEEIERD